MTNRKMLLATAALALLGFTGAAGAQPRNDHRAPAPVVRHEVMRHETVRHDVRRPYVVRTRVLETLRLHHYVGIGDPYFLHGRYVVRSHDRFGHVVLVQIDPYTGAYMGVVRI